ncbi:hypothetical protein KJ877_04750 [bacterium]|nr:hypothetical protein [bacterium]MBU1990394.1 hypothetical protein [bacterium]
MEKELIEVKRATLKFYKYEQEGLVFYEFDATECTPPEPMVNAIVGLSLLKNKNERLVGIFFHEPAPLYARIPSDITYEATELENKDYRIVFKKA